MFLNYIQMEINLKDQIVIVDEAHNIEDSAREGASDLFTDEQLDKTYNEIHEMGRPLVNVLS